MKWLDKLKGKPQEPTGPFEPATDAQGNYIIRMYGGFYEQRFDNKQADELRVDCYWKMRTMLEPYINVDDWYDRSVWTLSKSKASEIISAMEPEWKHLEEQE